MESFFSSLCPRVQEPMELQRSRMVEVEALKVSFVEW